MAHHDVSVRPGAEFFLFMTIFFMFWVEKSGVKVGLGILGTF